MFLLIISIILLIISFIIFYKANQIKLIKNQQQEKYKQKICEDINKLTQAEKQLYENNKIKQEKLNTQLIEWRNEREQEIQAYLKTRKLNIDQSVQQREKLAAQAIQQINQQFQTHIEIVKKQKQQLQNEIDKLKASLTAGVQARLREQEKKDKINFYKLMINDVDLADIQMLQNLKTSFHKPVVLSKLIWTQYFQKQMTELCDRVLGKNTVCGIYKITNLVTEQCYIGQSVNISNRWKEHCKCGLGIDAPASNTLYNSMQNDGVWNFTFELLEECSRDMLNQKEAFWIQMYNSKEFGLNGNKGIKK